MIERMSLVPEMSNKSLDASFGKLTSTRDSMNMTTIEVEKGRSQNKHIKALRESFGIVDAVLLTQSTLALFFIISSLALAVAGVAFAWALFFAALLLIVPMLPVFFAIKMENLDVESVFFNFHLGAALLNGMWLLLLLFFGDAPAGRLLVLFTVFLLQLLSLLAVGLMSEDKNKKPKQKQNKSWMHIFGSKKGDQKPNNTKTSLKSANSTARDISNASVPPKNASLQQVESKRPAQITRKPLVIDGPTNYNEFELSLMNHTAGNVPAASSPRNVSKKSDKSDVKTAIAANSFSNTKDSSYYMV
ncbi:hypothetical protein M3Y95_00650800 [Aphelenchoides besseyi]|nr:hypothetical protein M3Y95_00650800 [Aphelenchoides besseyi]